MLDVTKFTEEDFENLNDTYGKDVSMELQGETYLVNELVWREGEGGPEFQFSIYKLTDPSGENEFLLRVSFSFDSWNGPYFEEAEAELVKPYKVIEEQYLSKAEFNTLSNQGRILDTN